MRLNLTRVPKRKPMKMISAEELEEESLKKIPNMDLAQSLFLLQCKFSSLIEKKDAQEFLEKEIMEKNMGPFYKYVCQQLQWTVDKEKLEKMEEINKQVVEQLDEKIKDAEDNLGETEIRGSYLNKAEHYILIGDKENALSALRKSYEKTSMLGHKLDNVFQQIRVGFFFMDNDVITRNLEKATSLIEEGGDWDRRNRLKVYKGYYSLTVRDFKTASLNFLESISTFTSYELMSYKKFVEYTVLLSIISLKRAELGKKVIKCSEILENLHNLPVIRKYLNSLYECQYKDFFIVLVEIERYLQCDRLLFNHVTYYIREMRIIAYAQLLESYQSLTLQYMGDAFGVSSDFIDKELSRFISAGRLNCKIDKVGGIVETNRPDSKNHQYQAVIKQGDALLNRIQKLSRVITI
ncbi:26S proteasome non-ATPase regulatory subunit 6 isoform X2 [Hydra vulgaris]|uniref:26S proteasome non-ATPase regulatory subunit 6 isoform X2 n=1 Tax=Hydra vulgaris TaxID=6087 RepID=UPI001F5E9521|nr:26S proteasome non-ATPase regulatory subunit 6 isoform X2 [Hydra vulgaris]